MQGLLIVEQLNHYIGCLTAVTTTLRRGGGGGGEKYMLQVKLESKHNYINIADSRQLQSIHTHLKLWVTAARHLVTTVTFMVLVLPISICTFLHLATILTIFMVRLVDIIQQGNLT